MNLYEKSKKSIKDRRPFKKRNNRKRFNFQNWLTAVMLIVFCLSASPVNAPRNVYPKAKSNAVIDKYLADKKAQKEIDRMLEVEKALIDIDDIKTLIAQTSKLNDKDLANKKPDVHEKISFMQDGASFVPVRTITDILNASVEWNDTTQNVTITDSTRSFTMSTKDNILQFRNGKVKVTKSALILRNDTLYAPVSELVQALGAKAVIKGEDITISPPMQSTTLLVWTNNATLPDYGASTIVRSTKYYTTFQYNTLAEAQNALKLLKARSDVFNVELNEWIFIDDPVSEQPTDESLLRASYDPIYNASVKPAINYEAYMSSTSGVLSNTTVAVIDSGFGSTDPVFDGRMLAGYDVADNDNDVYNPGSDHGSGVASMIALFSRPNVKIMPFKATPDSTPNRLPTNNIENSIYYAIALNVNVINISAGGSGNQNFYSIKYAYNAGIITCVSAGNDGVDAINQAPANIDCAITVGAIDATTSGYPRWANTNYGDVVDTYAPGRYLLCANNGGTSAWSWYSGTSLSSPIVAGGIADILGYQMTRGKYLISRNVNAFVRRSNSGDRFDLYALNNMRMNNDSLITIPVPPIQFPTALTLNKTSTTLTVGETEQLTATIKPSNETVIWISDNKNVATVSSNGTVTGIAPGTATITVIPMYIQITPTCTVTVIDLNFTGFTINKGDKIALFQTVDLDFSFNGGSPTHFMASENSNFNGSVWQEYNPTASKYTFASSNPGSKTVYAKLKNGTGETEAKSSNILYKPAHSITQGKMYPSPAENLLNVELTSEFTNFKVEVYTSSGGLLLSQQFNNPVFKIDISSCPSGILIVRILDNKTGTKVERTIIKH